MRRAIADSASALSGEARLRLTAGAVSISGRRLADQSFDRDLASFDVAGGFDQADAGGFIRLAGLRLADAPKAVAP